MERDFLGKMPQVQFFSDNVSYKKDGRVVPAGTPGATQRNWNERDYAIWADYLTEGGKNLEWNDQAGKRMEEFY